VLLWPEYGLILLSWFTPNCNARSASEGSSFVVTCAALYLQKRHLGSNWLMNSS
jgi:hypothetical protein